MSYHVIATGSCYLITTCAKGVSNRVGEALRRLVRDNESRKEVKECNGSEEMKSNEELLIGANFYMSCSLCSIFLLWQLPCSFAIILRVEVIAVCYSHVPWPFVWEQCIWTY